MSIHQKLACLAWVVAVTFACTGCRRGSETDEAEIDVPTIVEQDPTADRPSVDFPPSCQQADAKLNAFITQVLKVCEEGDFDGFCQFMGTTERPPSQDDFKRLWHGIGRISVKSVRGTESEPPQYFVHAVARLRKPDNEKRTERDIVIRVFKEADEWRISGAPKEIVRKVLAADSQPASAPEGDGAVRPAASQPTRTDANARHSTPAAASKAGHAVYNKKAHAHKG
jgi:hypothetical protein